MNSKIYNTWNSIEKSTLSPLEMEYVESLLGNKAFSKGHLELQKKFLLNTVTAEDFETYGRLSEIEKAFNVINGETSKKEFLERCEVRFDMNSLADRLFMQYSVSPITTPFIRDVMADMYMKVESGEILDVNRRLRNQNFRYISKNTLMGLSSMMLKEIEARSLETDQSKIADKKELNKLNGGYALYIMAQDFAKLPWPLDYAFNPTADLVVNQNPQTTQNSTANSVDSFSQQGKQDNNNSEYYLFGPINGDSDWDFNDSGWDNGFSY